MLGGQCSLSVAAFGHLYEVLHMRTINSNEQKDYESTMVHFQRVVCLQGSKMWGAKTSSRIGSVYIERWIDREKIDIYIREKIDIYI